MRNSILRHHAKSAILGAASIIIVATSHAQTVVDLGETSDGAGIVGGDETIDFPTVGASLDADGGFCTNTLIGCRTVLTAAHCRKPTHVFFPHFGFYKVDPTSTIQRSAFPNHPGVHNDVELLTLETAVVGARPSPLPTISSRPPETLDIVGFGRAGFDDSGFGTLRYGSIRTESCGAAGGGSYKNDTHVCWHTDTLSLKGEGNSNTCHGDSGGPTFRGKERVIVAVTSGGRSDTTCGDEPSASGAILPDFSWNVQSAPNLKWISESIKSAGAPVANSALCAAENSVNFDIAKVVKGGTEDSTIRPKINSEVRVRWPVRSDADRITVGAHGSWQHAAGLGLSVFDEQSGGQDLCTAVEEESSFGFCTIDHPMKEGDALEIRLTPKSSKSGDAIALVQIVVREYASR